MKICFFSGDITRSGGTERVALNIANELLSQRKGYEIHILSVEHAKDKSFFYISKDIKTSYILENNDINPIIKYLKIVQSVRNYMLEHNIDILIDIDTILSVFSIPALALTSTKHIAWEHFTINQNLGVRYRDWGRKLATKFSDAIVVLTKKDQQNFESKYNTKVPVYNIYNPIIMNENNSQYDIESKVILSAGRLTHQKGFDILIEVAALVFSENPSWKWYILGEGGDRDKLQKKIKEYNLVNNIILEGNVDNIEEYYQRASLFVLTSRFEPFGLVLTEAKSYGLPCVSFDVDAGPSEIILDSINGFLIKPYNIEEMATKINYLIENPHSREKQSNLAMKDTEKYYLDTIIDQWNKLLSSLVN